jgi:hypothetical protein
MLEVEDVEQRQRRLQDVLERLNGEGSSTEQSPNLTFDFGARRTFAIEPLAELLARVREFLPQIERSNVELSQRDPRNIDIEHIEETDEHVVEMNLGLGVFEQRAARRSGSISSSSSSSGSPGRVTSDSSSTDSTVSDSDSDSSSDTEDDANRGGSSGSPRMRPIRPLPKRQSPMIQVLASKDEKISCESAGDCPAP